MFRIRFDHESYVEALFRRADSSHGSQCLLNAEIQENRNTMQTDLRAKKCFQALIRQTIHSVYPFRRNIVREEKKTDMALNRRIL